MKELSEQDGSKIKHLDINSTTENVIRYVDIELPKKQGLDKGEDGASINENALEGLEEYLSNEVSDISDVSDIVSTPDVDTLDDSIWDD